ncbi:DNAH14 [Acrasis kona]|uniref:DNAH14 n=1 Tax=Acrasis kona TaxID=1008807 RepID=A0AAW2ZBA1_9EUKA
MSLLSQLIREGADKTAARYAELRQAEAIELETPMTGEKLEKEIRRYRDTRNASNWFTWLRAHKGKGAYADFKDDNFFKYRVKQILKPQNFVFFVSALTAYAISKIIASKLTAGDPDWYLKDEGLFPYGMPGRNPKLNAHLEHLLHEDNEQGIILPKASKSHDHHH